ncbi:MAG: glycerol-3-phosphate 1-O-acyltransferase PlsY [Chloroflexota bacterium]|jgi:glycerol-3-phosphate acyltransferase PlsY|nr:glycerol-3-phosphate 1-O-acyltransferase PlsY [Chloroflexota bacterium]
MEPALVQGVLLVLAGYLIGSLPMGVIVARLTGGRDPRSVGSGRTGGTNALRAMGPGRGLAVGILDIAKGAVPVLLAISLGADQLVQALTGISAVLGSSRSIFLRLHGGRGVATAIGAMLVIQPIAVVLSAPVFFGVIWLSRYVSLGSLLGSAAAGLLLLVLVALGASPPVALVFGIGAVALVWIAHADNIARLLTGEERKLESLGRDIV